MAWLAAAVALTLGVCATRPVNPPVSRVDLAAGYRLDTRPPIVEDKENLVILAFSGGGTCAAAFSYGVLEALRRIEIEGPKGRRIRLLDHVDLVTGYAIDVSFAALEDATEREYLNHLPTPLVLPPEAVDRLRAAAGTIVLQSPEFKRLLHETGARLVETHAH